MANGIDPNLINIYGDQRLCCKCKKKADVVEQGRDYCAEHYCQKSTGLTLDQLKQEMEKLRFNKHD